MSIMEEMEAAGVEIDHHYSDLYVPVTPETKRIVSGYTYKANVTTFRSLADGALWYDIPFAYAPYWQRALRRGPQ